MRWHGLAAEIQKLWRAKDVLHAFAHCLGEGQAAIESEMTRIFADHPTGEYVGKIREVVQISQDVALVHAVAGVVPAGQADLNPALNSVQRMLCKISNSRWEIVLYHNTPAQFHGRPEMVEKLTAELREARAQQK